MSLRWLMTIACERPQEKIVVASGIEQGVFGERAGRYQSHHVTPDDALGAAFAGLSGIFKLLADSDAVTLFDQPVQIFVGTDDRNPA